MATAFRALKKGLVVEDEESSQTVVSYALRNHYLSDAAHSLTEARALLKQHTYEFILLDIGLPDGSGYELLQDIRSDQKHRDVPVLMLSLKTEIDAKVRGFDLGACDYISKPFEARELLARLKSHLSRSSGSMLSMQTLRIGRLLIQQEGNLVSIESQSEFTNIELSPLEYRLLIYLVSNKGRVCTRPDMVNKVWNRRFLGSRTIDRHMSSLRAKLGPISGYIQTVREVGYRFLNDEEESFNEHRTVP
jgi:DNA-binding response OmpR family regulator